MSDVKKQRVVVVGGSGFVGSTIMERLVEQGHFAVSVSRSGAVPPHLTKTDWAGDASKCAWVSGDVLKPDSLDAPLTGANAVVVTIGSPPVPTFNAADEETQRQMNGDSNVNAIKACERAGVPRVVMLGAAMPAWSPAGYLLGKTQATQYARNFVAELPTRSATILQPGAIYGTRHTAGGTPIPLWVAMQPVSVLHRFLGTPLTALANKFPWALKGLADSPFVDVAKVANLAVKAATAPPPFPGAPLDVRCRVVDNAEILEESLDDVQTKDMTTASS